MKKLITLFFALLLTAVTFSPSHSAASTFSKNPFSTDAELYIYTAEANANILKKEITIEYTKTIKKPNNLNFTVLKECIAKGKNALPKVKNKTLRNSLQAKLNVEETVFTHTQAYIDAISSGEHLAKTTAEFKRVYNEDPLSDTTEKAYHTLSYKINKQAKLLYKVDGKSTRDAILKKYKAPAEAIKKEKIQVITVKMSIDKLYNLSDSDASNGVLEKHIQLIEKQMESIKDTNVKNQIKALIAKFMDASAIYQLILDDVKYFNEENIDELLKNYSMEASQLENQKSTLSQFFSNYNVTAELQDIKLEELNTDDAIVVTVYKYTKTDVSDFKDNITTSRQNLIKVNGEWKFSGGEVTTVDYNK
jgi:hypothetical protein